MRSSQLEQILMDNPDKYEKRKIANIRIALIYQKNIQIFF
jgi:hypothetical protein